MSQTGQFNTGVLHRLHSRPLEKIQTQSTDVDIGDSINLSPAVHTRGHGYKLFKNKVLVSAVPFSVSVLLMHGMVYTYRR